MVCLIVRNIILISRSLLQGVTDKALGGAMMAAAAFVFIYYTTWALLLVRFVLCIAKSLPI